jgi:endogenous inhibitor of DNA gyrase (YacG/DUF329 family)
MTQIGESIAVIIGNQSAEATSPCWFCEEDASGRELVNNEVADPDTSDADPVDLVPENNEQNSSSELGTNLGSRPKWHIPNPLNESESTEVIPGAHHCIPGGASLAKATDLHKFMRKGEHYRSDIGYNVNDKENGVWLPGNYAVRSDAAEFNYKTWSAQTTMFQNQYVLYAVQRSGGRQFHDAHRKYNRLAKKSLLALAGKMKLPTDEACPVCEKKKEQKDRSPFGLVGRLHKISREYRAMLQSPTARTVQAGFYTSSKMKKIFV